MKNTMYIDTAGKKCIVGIVDKNGNGYSSIEDNRKITFRKCYESIRRSSKKAGMVFSDIERVIVCTGPRIIYRYKNRDCTFKRIMF